MAQILRHSIYSAFPASVRSAAVEEGAGAPSRRIAGQAIVFNARSEIMDGDRRSVTYEVIDPEAVTRELLDASDIRMTLFHDMQQLLARSRRGQGTLEYDISESGVNFAFDAPDTVDGQRALELVRRGDIAGCSFMFGIDPEDRQAVELVECGEDAEGRSVREVHIRRIAAVYDFTLTDSPAYPTTSVNLRELCAAAHPEQPVEPESTESTETITLNPQEREMDEPNLTPAGELNVAPAPRSLTAQVREALLNRRHAEIILSRAEGEPAAAAVIGTDTVAAAAPALVPLRIQDIIDDVEEGLIYNQIGTPISHSNSGEFIWPSYTAGSCRIIGEKEAIAASEINFSQIKAKPERFAARFDVSWQALNQTDGIVESVVRKALALAMQRAINKLLLSPTKPEGSAALEGPLVKAVATAVSLGANPTYKKLMAMKAKLLATGVAFNPVWVMSAATACDLEATPRDAGSGIMVIENGRLCGYPVFISHEVTDDYIALGDWSYQPAGFFGEVRLTVDPVSAAEQDLVKFILNFDFATATVRPEAFVVGKKA